MRVNESLFRISWEGISGHREMQFDLVPYWLSWLVYTPPTPDTGSFHLFHCIFPMVLRRSNASGVVLAVFEGLVQRRLGVALFCLLTSTFVGQEEFKAELPQQTGVELLDPLSGPELTRSSLLAHVRATGAQLAPAMRKEALPAMAQHSTDQGIGSGSSIVWGLN
eukprot:Skav232698  [mRNA]  locus=scaffold860:123010:125812:- [translate_table: standard]